jgi:hypothetical protein
MRAGCCRKQFLKTSKSIFMGEIRLGMIGPVSGKVGPVVGVIRNGKNHLRAKPGKRSGQPSDKQMDQQVRFSVVAEFLRPIRNLLTLGYTNLTKGVSARQQAQAYTLETAVTGTYPDYEVDPSQVYIAAGVLDNVDNPQAGAIPGGTINFSWMDNSSYDIGAEATDRALLVAYNVEAGRCMFTSGTALRSAGAATLVAPHFAGQTVHTWIAFISESGKQSSDSIYTGMITLP